MAYGAPNSGAGANFNAIVNGDFSVDQVNPNNTNPQTIGVTAAVSRNQTGADAWSLVWDSNAAYNVVYDREPTSPALGTQGWCGVFQNTGAGLGAADRWLSLVQYLEGLSLAPLVYGPAYLSFSVMSPFTGPHYATLFAGNSGVGGPATGPSFVMRYNVLTANAWQFVSLGGGLRSIAGIGPLIISSFGTNRQATLHFPLEVGSDFFTANINAWNASPSNALAGADTPQMRNMLTPFRVGDVALTPVPVIGRYPRIPPQQNMLNCQRYFWNTRIPAGASFTSVPLRYYARIAGVFNDGINVYYPAPMVTTPTITPQNIITPALTTWQNQGIGASGVAAIESLTEKYAFIRNPQVVGDSAGDLMLLNAVFDARLV